VSPLATVPAKGLLRFRVNAKRGNLRAVGEKLDLLGAAVRRDQVDNELGERFDRTKGNCPLRRLTNAHQHEAALLVMLPDVIFQCACGLLVENV
jgi:hypothetical protein